MCAGIKESFFQKSQILGLRCRCGRCFLRFVFRSCKWFLVSDPSYPSVPSFVFWISGLSVGLVPGLCSQVPPKVISLGSHTSFIERLIMTLALSVGQSLRLESDKSVRNNQNLSEPRGMCKVLQFI